jgi:hypothetical protein
MNKESEEEKMILTNLFAVMLILGLVLMYKFRYDDLELAGLIFTTLGSLFLMIVLGVIIVAHAMANNTIQKNKLQYDGLCKRYEIVKSEYEDVSKSDVIADITAWNTEVYNTKYWTENPWTNWFNPKDVADNLEYILLE